MLIRISLCFILMFGCRRINRKRKIVSYKQACINYLSFFITLLVAYSNSSLQSCCVVFFIGFAGRNQGVLSDFYLLRGFSRDCIVILLSLIFTLLRSFCPIHFYALYRCFENFSTCFYQINRYCIAYLQC